MPAPRHESVSAQAFTEVTRACLRLTFALCWSLPQLSSYSTNGGSALVRRSDSDPVRRQGPERGSTGEGGRPRSFLSGPPRLRSDTRRAGRALFGRTAEPRPAFSVGSAKRCLDGLALNGRTCVRPSRSLLIGRAHLHS